jgi:hypothetical protein
MSGFWRPVFAGGQVSTHFRPHRSLRPKNCEATAVNASSQLLPPRRPTASQASPWLLWRRLIARLRERGRNETRESGAFLLGRQPPEGPARIVDFVLYDDLDPISLDNPRGEAVVDIFRLEGGKVLEHWDVIQPIGQRQHDVLSSAGPR